MLSQLPTIYFPNVGWLKNVFLFDLNSFVDGIHILKAGTEGKEKKPSL